MENTLERQVSSKCMWRGTIFTWLCSEDSYSLLNIEICPNFSCILIVLGPLTTSQNPSHLGLPPHSPSLSSANGSSIWTTSRTLLQSSGHCPLCVGGTHAIPAVIMCNTIPVLIENHLTDVQAENCIVSPLEVPFPSINIFLSYAVGDLSF